MKLAKLFLDNFGSTFHIGIKVIYLLTTLYYTNKLILLDRQIRSSNKDIVQWNGGRIGKTIPVLKACW